MIGPPAQIAGRAFPLRFHRNACAPAVRQNDLRNINTTSARQADIR